MTDRRRNGLILLLVAGLIAASLVVIATKKTRLGLDLKGGVELVYQAQADAGAAQGHPGRASTARSTSCASASTSWASPSPRSSARAATRSRSGCPTSRTPQRAQRQVGKVAQLFFYDWEKNVLGPDLKPNPSDPNVTGGPQAGQVGGLSQYEAVKRASKRPPIKDGDNTTRDQYYLFGPAPQHKLLAGPEDTEADLVSELPGPAQAAEQRGP